MSIDDVQEPSSQAVPGLRYEGRFESSSIIGGLHYMGVAYNYHSAHTIPYIIGTVTGCLVMYFLHNLLAVCSYSTWARNKAYVCI